MPWLKPAYPARHPKNKKIADKAGYTWSSKKGAYVHPDGSVLRTRFVYSGNNDPNFGPCNKKQAVHCHR